MASDVKVPRLLRVREVEKLTGIAPWRLYELIKRGKGPPHMRVGKTIRVPEDALARWIDEQSKQHKPKEGLSDGDGNKDDE